MASSAVPLRERLPSSTPCRPHRRGDRPDPGADPRASDPPAASGGACPRTPAPPIRWPSRCRYWPATPPPRSRSAWPPGRGRPSRAPPAHRRRGGGRRQAPVRPPEGFSLHANVALPAHAREPLEHLCRYLLRPPLATERLTESCGGQLLYQLPHPRRDGSTHLLLDPRELIEKLSVLIPPPRVHLLRFHAPPRPASLRRGPPLERCRRARRGTGAKPFAARAPKPSLLRGRTTLLGGPDAAGVRGRRSLVPALRGPAPHRGRLPRGAEAARASGPAGAQRFPGRHRRPLSARSAVT